MEEITLNQNAEQDLLGFFEESPDCFVPIYKMLGFNSKKQSSSNETAKKPTVFVNSFIVKNKKVLKSNRIKSSSISLNEYLKSQQEESIIEPSEKPEYSSSKLPDNDTVKSDSKQTNNLNKHVIYNKNNGKLSQHKQIIVDKKQCSPVKTLVLTKDKASGDSFVLINDKLVPIKKIHFETVNNMCVRRTIPQAEKKVSEVKSEISDTRTSIKNNSRTDYTNSVSTRRTADVLNQTLGNVVKSDLIMNTQSDCDSQECDFINDNVKDKRKYELSESSENACSDLKYESKMNQPDTLEYLLNVEEGKLRKKIHKASLQRNMTVQKHKNGLLEIIHDLTQENLYLKRGLRVTHRRMRSMKNDMCRLQLALRGYVEEVQQLNDILNSEKLIRRNSDVKCDQKVDSQESDLKSDLMEVRGSEDNQETGVQVELLTAPLSNDYTIVNNNLNYDDVVMVNESSNTTPNIHIDAYSDSMSGIDVVLHQDINMGVCLDVPQVIAMNNGYGTQIFNSNANFDSQKFLWLCFNLCDKQDKDGDFPIHIAVANNDVKGVLRQCHTLMMKKLSVDLENHDGQTPLHLAVINKVSTSIVDTLKMFNADFSLKDASGNNIFHLAANNRYLRELHKNKLLDDAHINDINAYNYDGQTPLMIAVKNKNCEDAKVLIKLNADLNLQEKTTGKTALFHAVESNSLDLVNLLMANGAETSRTNFSGHRLQDTIGELDVSPTLKKLFNEMEEANLEMKKSKRSVPKHTRPFTFVSKKIKI